MREKTEDCRGQKEEKKENEEKPAPIAGTIKTSSGELEVIDVVAVFGEVVSEKKKPKEAEEQPQSGAGRSRR